MICYKDQSFCTWSPGNDFSVLIGTCGNTACPRYLTRNEVSEAINQDLPVCWVNAKDSDCGYFALPHPAETTL